VRRRDEKLRGPLSATAPAPPGIRAKARLVMVPNQQRAVKPLVQGRSGQRAASHTKFLTDPDSPSQRQGQQPLEKDPPLIGTRGASNRKDPCQHSERILPAIGSVSPAIEISGATEGVRTSRHGR